MIVALSVLAFVAGVFVWSFTEYALHRWSGHRPGAQERFAREHRHHHADGNFFAPTSAKLAAGVGVSAIVAPLLFVLAGVPGLIGWTGFIAAWGGYEWLHRRIHTHAPMNAYGAWARLHHLHHHFRRPDRNHGVTSPLWDVVFGTRDPVASVRLPRTHGLRWLVDDVDPALAARVVVAGRGQQRR